MSLFIILEIGLLFVLRGNYIFYTLLLIWVVLSLVNIFSKSICFFVVVVLVFFAFFSKQSLTCRSFCGSGIPHHAFDWPGFCKNVNFLIYVTIWLFYPSVNWKDHSCSYNVQLNPTKRSWKSQSYNDDVFDPEPWGTHSRNYICTETS